MASKYNNHKSIANVLQYSVGEGMLGVRSTFGQVWNELYCIEELKYTGTLIMILTLFFHQILC